ncbi:MAG: hypothetical protein J6K76_08990 [Spirochaetaceae bacterium]|nr:hypothetical protein [Spirochaetaceae bacterium]
MYKKITTLVLFCLVATIIFAQESVKPQKKVPAKEGNFEVIMGEMVDIPIDMERFEEVAARGARSHGWKVLETSPGVIKLKLEKRDWWVTMNICYWEDEYWYEYQDSWNLDAKPAKDKIHRNYRRWIANIEKKIYEEY